MSNLQRTSSLNNIENTIVTSPEILNTPSKKRKTMEKGNSDGQTTLHFGQKPPTSSNPTKDKVTLKTKEYKSLLSMMEEISAKLQNVVKVKDLDDIMKNVATKEEMKDCVNSAASKLSEENEQLRSELFTVRCENDELKIKVSHLEQNAENYQININAAHYKADSARDGLNDLEQHGRANSIRIFNLGGTPTETAKQSVKIAISFLNRTLGLQLEERDIDIAHRLPHFNVNNRKPRAMIVKFVRRMDKFDVIENRYKLSGKKIVIKEDLTVKNSHLLNEVSQRDDVKKAWVVPGGKVFAQMDNREKKVINVVSDLKQRLRDYEQSQTGGPKSPTRPNFNPGSANARENTNMTQDRLSTNPEQQLTEETVIDMDTHETELLKLTGHSVPAK